MLPTTYDPLFRRYAGSIPVAYLRALTQRESGFNPRANAGKAAAQGLLQITTVARDAFNRAQGTSYTRDDTLDPEVNIRIATNLLQRIIASYRAHPSANMREDWRNPAFVQLLTAGWNAGYSEGGGVGKVARYLEQRNLPVTPATVYQHAGAAGAVAFLSDPARARWHQSVAELYLAQPDRASAATPALGLMAMALLAWGGYTLLTR